MPGSRCLHVCILALGLALMAGCEREPPAPVAVELELLVAQQQNFRGQLVQTSGTVRGFDDPRHFWIEDDALNRVELVPADFVAEFVDREVVVIGRFTVPDGEQGRRIDVRTIRP